MNLGDYIWKASKGWEGEDAFWVWHIQSIRTPEEVSRQKCYLVVDARPQSFGLRLELEKPEGLKGSGSLQGMVRKYARTPAIGQPYQHDGHIFLPLFDKPQSPPSFWMTLAKKKPPEIAFVTADGTCLLKRSVTATHTKRHAYDVTPGNEGEGLGAILLAMIQDSGDRADTETQKEKEEQDTSGTLSSFQKDARNKIARRLKTAKKSLAKLESNLPSEHDIRESEDHARLLQQFLYRVKPDAHTLTITAAESGRDDDVTIALDPDASPGQNLEQAFLKIKKQKKARETGLRLNKKSAAHKASLERDLARLRSGPLPIAEVEAILREHKIAFDGQSSRKAAPVSLPYRRYQFADGAEVLVGKTAKDNDQLTKQAKANDLWLHTVAPQGSHVIIPTRGRQDTSESTIKKAAILALHFSKLRDDLGGEVYVTQKRHIKKKKGLPAGKWIIESASTSFFRYTSKELQAVLDALVP